MHGQLPLFLCLLVTGLVSNICRGATWIQEVSSRDGKCVLDDGSLKAVGEEWYDDEKCVEYDCNESDGIFHVSGASCGVMRASKRCRLASQPGHYPKCCPRPVCFGK